ncbi:UNVERIFIED_CONTAM: nrf-6 [Trichonephila clavipes]
MIVMGFYTTLFSYIGSGYLWPVYDTNPVCKENWWWNLLFINNFQSTLKQCMGWCWYLANDMQFYIISPLFLISLLRWPRIGYAVSATFLTISCFITFKISEQFRIVDGLSSLEYYFRDMEAFLDQYWEYFDKIHDKPYSRLGVYLIGLLLGHFVCHRRFKKIGPVHSRKVRLHFCRLQCRQERPLLFWLSLDHFCLHHRTRKYYQQMPFQQSLLAALSLVLLCLLNSHDRVDGPLPSNRISRILLLHDFAAPLHSSSSVDLRHFFRSVADLRDSGTETIRIIQNQLEQKTNVKTLRALILFIKIKLFLQSLNF